MPAAAMMPACRIAPPKRCLKTQASSMNAREPASTAPTGAPRPLVRSSQTLSNGARERRAPACPLATTAFISRAPSMWQASPAAWPAAQTSSICASGQHTPPTMLAVCSTDSARVRGM